MKKRILKTLEICLLCFAGFVILVMSLEPYYFWEMIDNFKQNINRRRTNGKTSAYKSIYEYSEGDLTEVFPKETPQIFKIPNLDDWRESAGQQTIFYKINIKDLGKQTLHIEHSISTGTISFSSYLPSFSTYFSPVDYNHMTTINLTPENNVSCFSVSKYGQNDLSECYPISLFFWPQTKYIEYLILWIHSKNEADMKISIK